MRVLWTEVGSAWKGEEASTLEISKLPEKAEATQEHMAAVMMRRAEGEGIAMSS